MACNDVRGLLTFSSQLETLKVDMNADGMGSSEFIELTDALTSASFSKADFRFGSKAPF